MERSTYILFINVNKDTPILAGRLGKIDLKKGIYLYIGSAKKNFDSRIKRHFSKNKKIFWHVDYLLSSENVVIKRVQRSRKPECQLAKTFLKKGLGYIKGFGSSDCRCPSHLIVK